MSTAKLSKNFLVKLIAVVAVVALVFGLAPVLNFADVSLSASAAAAPVYDPALGSYTTSTVNGSTVLTATPNEACGFRGWFLKDGTEVSYNLSYTLPSGASASDYVPVFYNFNLVKKASFEEYAVGTNMKTGLPADEIWEGTCDGEANGTGSDWTNASITDKRARTGSKSLKATSHSNTTYHDFFDLEPHTQYTLKFWYAFDPNTAATDTTAATTRYLSFAAVIGEDMETTIRGNSNNADYLAHRIYTEETGACPENTWKEVSMTFYTDDNTNVRLVLYYLSQYLDDKRSPAASPIYIDDLSLVKDVMATPDYFNEDFTNSFKTWDLLDSKRLSRTTEGGRLKVSAILTSGAVVSAPIHLKKGADYTISFDYDMSGVTDKYMPDENDGVLVTDPSLVTEENPNGYVWKVHNQTTGALAANWINFMLSTNSALSQTYYPKPASASESTYVWKVTDTNGVEYISTYGGGASSTGFGRYDSLKNLDCSKPLKVEISFTAHKTATVYFGSRLNGMGKYYLDNFVITQDNSNTDFVDVAINNAVSSKGTAIRTEGKQGMRYKTQIDKGLLTADMPYGIRLTEYGTAAIKTEYLGESELVVGGEYDYKENTYGVKIGVAYSFDNKTNLVFAEDTTSIDYTGVLMNIPVANWNTDYTARAYFKYVDKNGKTGIMYIEPSEIAVYPISKAAYSARNEENEFAESEEVRTYLYNNIISKFTDKIVNISDNSAPIYNNFQGIRSTIYHATTFFPDSHGRTYTEAQAAVEMDRLVDTKVDNVRTRFASQWMWTSDGWDWDSTKMTAYYKWAKMLQDRDISITLQAGWHLHDFVYFYNQWVATEKITYKEANSAGHSSIPEVNYMHGYSDNASSKVINKYGEDANAAAITAAGKSVGLGLTDEEYAHYSVAAARYAEWVRQGLNAFKAHGVYNVEYVLPFTETGYSFTNPDTKEVDTTYTYDEWTLMVIALNDALEKEGNRNNYKFIGPAQSIYAYQNRLSFIEYLYSKITDTDYENLLDINAMHQYTSPNTRAGYKSTVYEPYASYSLADENFNYYNDVLVNSGVRDMEFWCDEYFAHSPDAKWWNNVGMQMTQFAAGLTAGINTGVNRFLTWQMFDTLWDSEATHGDAVLTNSSEFSGGIHAVGTCPSLVHVDGKVCPKGEDCACTKNYNISSYVPRTTYYGINLIGKYMNNENAKVFATEVIDQATNDNGGVYVSAIKNDYGKTVILVVNTMPTTSSVEVNLKNQCIINFNRYTYDPNEIVPTAEAKSLPSDKTISLNGTNAFFDVIPAQSFAIYVEGGTFIGDDVEMPFESWDD